MTVHDGGADTLQTEYEKLEASNKLLQEKYDALEKRLEALEGEPARRKANSGHFSSGDTTARQEASPLLRATSGLLPTNPFADNSGGGSPSGSPHKTTMINGTEFELKPVSMDMWGATIVAIVKDFGELIAGQHSALRYLRFFMVMFCQLVNLLLQGLLLIQAWQLVVEPSISRLQNSYYQFHTTVFDADGTFNEAKWAAFPDDSFKHRLCNGAITQGTLTMIILSLWTTSMLGEISDALKLTRTIWRIEALPPSASYEDLLIEGDEEDTVTYLTTPVRAVLFVLVLLPRLTIGVVLLFVGLMWLTATASFADVFLNALALQFIINIDEIILSQVVPCSIQVVMQRIKFKGDEQRPVESETWELGREWISTFLMIMLIIAFVFYWYGFGQQVLPAYQHDIADHCAAYIERQSNLVCGIFGTNCFPYGSNATLLL